MKIGLGSISGQRHPAEPRTDGEVYRDAIAFAEEVERLGFDSIWCSEHHFFDDSYLPSLLPLCAAIAARTSRISIGTDVLLLPLHEAVRIAEDAAVVDLLSGGRLILGVGQGWRPEEFEGLGVPLRGRHRLFEEQIAVLRQAWSDGVVTGGELLAYPGMPVTPKPERPGGPPVWVGAGAEPAVRRAGRIADGFMATWCSPASFGRRVRWVREELEASGRDPAAFTLSVVTPVFAWEDESLWGRVRESLWYYEWKYEDMADARGRTGRAPLPPPLPAERESKLRHISVLGSPGEVAEGIRAYDEAAGGGVHFVAELAWPGLERGLLAEAVQLLAERVLPQLR